MILPDKQRLKLGRAAVIDCRRRDCALCAQACGFSAISAGEDGLPFSDPKKCVGCGGCAAVCPDGAVFLLKDRLDGSFEFTFPFAGELPEIDGTVMLTLPGEDEPRAARVIQVIPKRTNAANALVRAAAAWSPKGGTE